jgi:DNA-directed RNA polymerase beta' subunit
MNNLNKSKVRQVESIRIGLASPERIRKWAERTLPNGKILGQVTSSQTVNYKTLKPEKGGLFCERIFGPIKDFECSCGRKKNQIHQQYCSECFVEFTSSRVRRYRLGYIQLVSPVTHVWYLKGTPSYISILLDMRRKKVEAITYCTETTNVSETTSIDVSTRPIIKSVNSANSKDLNKDSRVPDQEDLVNDWQNFSPEDNFDSKRVLPSEIGAEEENFIINLSEEKKLYSNRVLTQEDSRMLIHEESNPEETLVKNNFDCTTKADKILSCADSTRVDTDFDLSNISSDDRPSESQKESQMLIQENKKKVLLSEREFPEEKLKKKLGGKKIPINNYYTISQECSWEIQDDWNKFLYYMLSYPEDKDIPVPFYLSRIRNPVNNLSEVRELCSNQISGINNFYSTNSVSNLDEIRELYSSPQINLPLTGAEAILYFLENLDLQLLDRQIRVELFELNEEINEFENQGFLFFHEQRRLQFLLYIRAKKLRRLKLVRHFRRTKARPEWMILSILPVLPPDLRPIIQLDGDQVAVSDLNKLYQKVLFRNNRMKRHRKNTCSTKSDEIKYAQRLLQEAVDALIENGKGGADPICASNERPLKSLSDMLKGKKGRFRQNLLGKRVDYSGRSVIVVGPKLKIHECGLPKEMAIELFQPFLIRRLMSKKFVRTIVGAKGLIQRQDPIIWPVLQQVLQNHPVLLNRAPTLHRLGIQAFQPKLVDGRAILLHPLVCTAFNADFDGDQMAVHVPLSFQARAEAWKLMWSRNNLLSPATGQPILVPSQDMILGCYYLTTTNSKSQLGKGNYFVDLEDVVKAYTQKKLYLHAPIWVYWPNLFETETEFEYPLELRVDCYGNVIQIFSKFQKYFDANKKKISQFIRTTPGRILVNQIILKIFKQSKKNAQPLQMVGQHLQ